MAAAPTSRRAARSRPSRSVSRSTWRALTGLSARFSRDSLAAANDRALPPAYSIFASSPGLYPSPPSPSRSSAGEKDPPASRAPAGGPLVLHHPPPGPHPPPLQLRLLGPLADD